MTGRRRRRATRSRASSVPELVDRVVRDRDHRDAAGDGRARDVLRLDAVAPVRRRHGLAPACALSPAWYFAEGATGTFFDTFFLLGNPQNADAHVTLTYLLDTGEVITAPVTIAAHARLTINPESRAPDARLRNAQFVDQRHVGRADRRGALDVLGRQGARRGAKATPAPGVDGAGADLGPRRRTRRRRARLPHLHPAWRIRSRRPPNVTVTYLRETGAPIVKTYTVPATARLTIDVNAVAGARQSARSARASTVTNDMPVIVERSMYWNCERHLLGGRIQRHGHPGRGALTVAHASGVVDSSHVEQVAPAAGVLASEQGFEREHGGRRREGHHPDAWSGVRIAANARPLTMTSGRTSVSGPSTSSVGRRRSSRLGANQKAIAMLVSVANVPKTATQSRPAFRRSCHAPAGSAADATSAAASAACARDDQQGGHGAVGHCAAIVIALRNASVPARRRAEAREQCVEQDERRERGDDHHRDVDTAAERAIRVAEPLPCHATRADRRLEDPQQPAQARPRVHHGQRESWRAARHGGAQRGGVVSPHRRPHAIEAGQPLAHSRLMEHPRPERRHVTRPDVDVHKASRGRPLVLCEHGVEVAAAEVMQHARRDDDVRRLAQCEGIAGDEAAFQPLFVREPLRRARQHLIAVGADQLARRRRDRHARPAIASRTRGRIRDRPRGRDAVPSARARSRSSARPDRASSRRRGILRGDAAVRGVNEPAPRRPTRGRGGSRDPRAPRDSREPWRPWDARDSGAPRVPRGHGAPLAPRPETAHRARPDA